MPIATSSKSYLNTTYAVSLFITRDMQCVGTLRVSSAMLSRETIFVTLLFLLIGSLNDVTLANGDLL